LEKEPQQFGDYHLLEKIATGGMAEVWRARSYGMAGFEKILVIKKVLDSLAKDDEFIRLFIDEARIAVQLLHVNIVQVFDLNQVDGTYFMAMEYVHGLDLARLVSKAKHQGAFPISLALFVVGEVLKALQFAHERKSEDGEPLRIVHCDISPQNVLVSFAGEVKITDFGISRVAFQATGVHDVVRGKYAYMSPEQVGGGDLDGRSDIFSLGIVLYELLTGRRLFKARSREETLERVQRAEVPSPRSYRPEVSRELESILLKALGARPSQRYQTAGEMLDEIGILMVREGHRGSNHLLAAYIQSVMDQAGHKGHGMQARQESRTPTSVVVLSVEAIPPPKSMGTPNQSLSALVQNWIGLVAQAGGEIWEHGEGSFLVCWVAKEGFKTSLTNAVTNAVEMKKVAHEAGYRMSAGVAPGVAQLSETGHRPPDGWELAGPFYLARWMMNLSAHRGRILLTEVGQKQVADYPTSSLGRISIQGNRYIHLYELG
jgi:serine/threonine protein kinase